MSGTKDLDNPFVEWFLEWIDGKGMTREDVARKMGVSSSSITNVVSRKKNLGLDLAKSLAKAIEVDEDVLLEKAGLVDRAKGNRPASPIVRLLANVAEQLDKEDQERLLQTAQAWQKANERKTKHQGQSAIVPKKAG